MLKKSTKALSAILSLSSVASVVAPVTTMAAASIDTLIATAEKSKSFYDFNQVYAALQKLPAASKAKYTAKVNELAGKVQQYADVIALLEKEVAFGKSGNAEDFNAILAEINSKISNATDKKYLTDELGAWGNKMLAAQPGYSAATDAIIAAWTSLASNDVDAIKAAVAKAKEAVEKLSHEANKAYLTKDITSIETKLATLEVVKLDSVKAVGAKKLEVTFNKAVDTAKAAVTVKKGTVAVNTDKVEFSADKKTATITTTTNLTKGDYTVSVAGLTETALTGVASVEDVKVSKINITSTKAPRLAGDKTAKVTYEVLNQYGEKMTGQSISWTISTGVAANVTDSVNGVMEITAAAGADFIPGSVVYITGVHAASGTVVNGQVEIVLASQADALTFKGVYDTTNSKFVDLPAGFATAGTTSGRYVILYQVNDQYGNTLASPDFGKLVFTSNNPLFVASVTTRSTITVDNVTYQALDLVAGTAVDNGGTVTLQAISTVTGKVSSYTAQAEALSGVKTFTMSAPTTIVAENDDVEIPFTAVDQYGNAVTKFEALNGKVTLSPAPASAGQPGLRFVKQNDGSAKLMYKAATGVATATVDHVVYLTSVVPNGGSFSSLMLNVKDEAIPTAIIGLDSDKSVSVARRNSVDIKGEHLVVQDQYGRTMTDDSVKAWLDNGANSIVVTSSDTSDKFTVGKNPATGLPGTDNDVQVIDSATDFVRITAGDVVAGTENITFTLATNNNGTTGLVDSSAKLFTFANVDKSAYASYTVADLGKMYNDGQTTSSSIDTDYDKTVEVYGVKADGTKVLLPAADYTVTVDTTKLDVNGNVITDVATGGYDATADLTENGSAKDASVTVLVTVNDRASGSAIAILSKELTVSRVASKVTTVTFKSSKVTAGKATVNTTSSAITTAILTSFIDTVKDQYGVDSTEAPKITITNLTKVDGSNFAVAANTNGTTTANVTSATLGDKFTVTYKYASGVSVTLDLTVGLPQ